MGGVVFHSEPIHDDSYIKTKVIKNLFDGNEFPKERIGHVCIACINVDSVLRVDKKVCPQVYLEQCKYKIKKREKN